MNYRITAILIICIAVIATAGCTGTPGNDAVKSTAQQDGISAPGGSLHSASEATPGSAGSRPMVLPAAAPVSGGSGGIDTKIIKTAFLTLEVRDVTATVETLGDLARQNGGYVSSTNIQKNYNDQLTGTVIIRVPAAEFDTVLTGAKTLGAVKSISTQGEDVTEEVR